MIRGIYTYVKSAVVAVGLTALLVSSASAVPGARLEVTPGPIYTDSFFDVFVYVDNVDILDPLIAFGFDTSNLPGWTLTNTQVNSVLFNDDSLLFGGFPQVAGSTLGIDGSNILLATLQYKSSSAGSFLYQISGDATISMNHGLITWNDVSDISASKTVEVLSHPVPEPATIILIGSGIAAFVGMALSRKRSLNKQV